VATRRSRKESQKGGPGDRTVEIGKYRETSLERIQVAKKTSPLVNGQEKTAVEEKGRRRRQSVAESVKEGLRQRGTSTGWRKPPLFPKRSDDPGVGKKCN